MFRPAGQVMSVEFLFLYLADLLRGTSFFNCLILHHRHVRFDSFSREIL